MAHATICDRCGKTFQSPYAYMGAHNRVGRTFRPPNAFNSSKSDWMDICPECDDYLDYFLNHKDIDEVIDYFIAYKEKENDNAIPKTAFDEHEG